jgi:hypothetical protein
VFFHVASEMPNLPDIDISQDASIDCKQIIKSLYFECDIERRGNDEAPF